MNRLTRTRVRLRRVTDTNIAHFRAAPALILSTGALAALTIVLIVTAAKTGWTNLLQGFASNVVAAAVVAGFAYLVFVLRFRRAKLSEYLDRYRAADSPGDGQHRTGSHTALLETVVDELLASRPPRSCLLVGDADIARSDALAELPGLLVARKRVPIIVDLRREGTVASIAVCARTRFVAELVGSAGDETSGGRVFANLLAGKRAVAVVAGLDRLNEGRSRGDRRDAIADLLTGCLVEQLPFVAALPDELAPSISEIAVLRIPPVSRAELATRFARRIRELARVSDPAVDRRLVELFESVEPTRDPFYLELAAELLSARTRRGESPVAAAEELFAERRPFQRHLGWMCERLLECGLADAAAASSPVALALGRMGTEMDYRQELPTTWGDACGGLDQEGERRFAVGASVLARSGALTISDDGDRVLRFAHPGWLALAGAIGIGLDPSRWADLLRPGVAQATLDALTAALLLDRSAACVRERSFLKLLQEVAAAKESEISLDLALAVLQALQLDAQPLELGPPELSTLARAWRSCTDIARLSFIAEIDIGQGPALGDFLWQQVVPPAFHTNSYRVRRAACEKLASLGALVWGRLEGTWSDLVDAAERRNLSAAARRELPDWEEFGLPLASLCWVLPSLVTDLDGDAHRNATALLHRVRAIALGDRETRAAERGADIGIEISLAEGFKIAAARKAPPAAGLSDSWCEETRQFFDLANSWVSEQVLLQSLALADPDDERIAGLARETAEAADQHPFVRETAALVCLGIAAQPTDLERRQYIWLDDVEALDDGGLDLVPEGHRLLGLSTLLINFAENAFEAGPDGVQSRNRALTSRELPRCFCRSDHTATMFEVPCDCEFGLCGPGAQGQVGHRRFSRAFAKRAEATSRAPTLSHRDAFVGDAFRDVWRALDAELAREQAGT